MINAFIEINWKLIEIIHIKMFQIIIFHLKNFIIYHEKLSL